MSDPSITKVSRTRSGYRIRIVGRGTLRESPTVHAFARHVLNSEPVTLVIDLTACTYLDSTFLGGMIDLHRRYGVEHPTRLLVAASPADRTRLLAPNCLDGLFHYLQDDPEVIGDDLELPTLTLAREELGRHVLESHRRLVELGGPARAAFQGVVDRLAQELISR
jgi:anti-anti-sigma regulatory factor